MTKFQQDLNYKYTEWNKRSDLQCCNNICDIEEAVYDFTTKHLYLIKMHQLLQ